MGRKTIYSPEAIQEMKQAIRTGRPVAQLAEEFSRKWGKNVTTLRTKMYGLAQRTYKIREWKGTKRRKFDYLQPIVEQKQASTAPRIERYEDHIRIYF